MNYLIAPELKPDYITYSKEPSVKAVITKLSEVMAEVERVAKNGHNAFHKYDYATEADIVSAVRKAMSQRKLMMLPRTVQQSRTGDITTLHVEFDVIDGDSGETVTVGPIIGEGQDKGDKGPYKALTGAVKYALLKLFLIPTGDDPEKDEESTVTAKKPAPAPIAAPPKPEQAPPKKTAAENTNSAIRLALEGLSKEGKKVSEVQVLVKDIQKLPETEQNEIRPLFRAALEAVTKRESGK